MELISTGYVQGWQKQGWTPHIVPIGMEGGNVVAVPLDCSSRSSLKWNVTKSLLDQSQVLWELTTDLFDHPEPEEMAILAFELAIDHVVTTLFPQYSTFGILLYRGLPSVSPTLLRSLAARLPDSIIPFVAFDLTAYQGSSFFHALRREELSHIALIVKGAPSPYAQPAIGWDTPSPYGTYGAEGHTLPSRRLPHALCYGPGASFEMPSELCRCIPEALLCEEWDGVDVLYTAGLSSVGKRAVQGFMATGGEVYNVSK